MTLAKLTTAQKLAQKLQIEITEEDGFPATYVYQRATGQLLIAVFRDQLDFDLNQSPDVVAWARLEPITCIDQEG